MESVLFLCTGNSCRSQMAEALLRQRAGGRFAVYSAGAVPKGIHPFTIQVLEEKGIDTSALRSKNLNELKITPDHVIAVCGNAETRCPQMPGANRQFWPFDDPPAFQGTDQEKLAKFRAVRDQIEKRIEKWLRETK